jgi:hypothetical protein
MPHPTTPSSDEEVTGPSCSSEGANLQTTMAEFDVIERPFTTTPLSNPLKSPLSVKADVRCPADVVPTPPQSPVRSSLWKPPSYRADPEIPSPPITPESQRYSKAPTITGRHIKAGSDSCKGLTERLTEQLAVGGHDKGLDGGTRNMGNEKARNIPIATELMAGHQVLISRTGKTDRLEPTTSGAFFNGSYSSSNHAREASRVRRHIQPTGGA